MEQFDLDVVERIEIGEAVAYRSPEQRIAVEQFPLTGDLEQRLDRGRVFGSDAPEDAVAQGGVGDQPGVPTRRCMWRTWSCSRRNNS